MQITRQRMRPEVNINTQENCPTCQGTGKIGSALLLEDSMEKNLLYLSTQQHKQLELVVHPIVHAYLTKGWPWSTRVARWKRKFGQQIKVKANTAYHLTEYRFFDRNQEEIKL
jgi:ribonuclease G